MTTCVTRRIGWLIGLLLALGMGVPAYAAPTAEVPAPPSAGPALSARAEADHPVDQGHAALGGDQGWLGAPTGELRCGLTGGGCSRAYAGGAIYWSPATGARFVRGEIGKTYGLLGAERSRLGYPIGDEECWISNGCFQRFQNGSIYWSASTGAHDVQGAIADVWGRTGWETGELGYPTSNEQCEQQRVGCRQQFQGGSIYWSGPTGAHVLKGAIRDLWINQSVESEAGLPIGGEDCGVRQGAYGCLQPFQHASIAWSPEGGAHILDDPFLSFWLRADRPQGPIGWPIGERVRVADGPGYRQEQDFTGGRLSVWDGELGDASKVEFWDR